MGKDGGRVGVNGQGTTPRTLEDRDRYDLTFPSMIKVTFLL